MNNEQKILIQNTIDLIHELILDMEQLNRRIEDINLQCNINILMSINLHNVPVYIFNESAKLNIGDDGRKWLSQKFENLNVTFFSENLNELVNANILQLELGHPVNNMLTKNEGATGTGE